MTNTVTITLPRTEAHQALILLTNRLDDLRNYILDTDYESKYGQAMGEKIKYDDETYAHDLQRLVARIIDVL